MAYRTVLHTSAGGGHGGTMLLGVVTVVVFKYFGVISATKAAIQLLL